MIPSNPTGYRSVFATHFFHPIATLLETLEEIGARGPNEVQASPLENGYSIAIIVLTVMFLESVINSVQHSIGYTPPKKPLRFVEEYLPEPHLLNYLEELFVIRDIIAHNHIWEAKITWDENYDMKLLEAQITAGYGDWKFKKVINESTRRTQLLGLNIFPTRICSSDVVIVLKKAVDFLCAIESKDPKNRGFSIQPIKYKGEILDFPTVVKRFTGDNSTDHF